MTVLTPLTSVQEQLDRVFSDMVEDFGFPTTLKSSMLRGWRWPESTEKAWLPPVEVSETDKHYMVKVAVPGMKAEDIRVEIMDQTLQIQGETRQEETTQDKNIHRSEFRYGRFFRQLPLPSYVQTQSNQIQAKFENGILNIQLPKLADEARQKISIQVK